MSKAFERVIFNYITEYIEPFLSNMLIGFPKNYNTTLSIKNNTIMERSFR